MRLVLTVIGVMGVIALGWATQGYLGAYWNVRELGRRGVSEQAVEAALLSKGTAALLALRAGLNAAEAGTRLRCAKVLMEMGEDEGEAFLLAELKKHPLPDDGVGRQAESCLLTAWDLQDGPDLKFRTRLREAEAKAVGPGALLTIYNEGLGRFKNWADGYARRARVLQLNGEAYEARRDCLKALLLAPNHFEARVTLGRIELAVDSPYLAFKSFEHALSLNPRLKAALKGDFEEATRALDKENERRREEKRKRAPVA